MDLGNIEGSNPSSAAGLAGEAKTASPRIGNAQRDFVALGIAAAAIIMFVGAGGSVLPQVLRVWTQGGRGPDTIMVNALLLNVALIIFGWRRYKDLTREVGERRGAEQRASVLALTDPLTGCLNRRSVGPQAEELLAIARTRGHAVAFLLFDLDNFKTINDLNGHVAGDVLLKATALRVSELLPPQSVLARLGGDEFAAVVVFEPANPATIDRLADRLLHAVAMPVDHDGLSLETTISIGIASSDRNRVGDGQITAQALLHNADIAMYHAKKQGRNCHYWFEPEMANELRFRSELETGIRRGLTRGEFVPFYEQQIDLETGELVGFEMLARWQSPVLGLVGPDIFIPIAEEIGVIAEMSEQLIAQALLDASTWSPALTLSVNISAIQLRDPWFAQRILKLLVEANFPASRLEIEITESCLHENIGVVRSLITSLKNQGVAISLDDFGTGYSSLSQLTSLPFDRIKIDRSFVSSINASKDSSTIIKSITSLGEGMNLPITAEGIETREVLDQLRTMGKFKGQGYLYGRPVDAKTVAIMLEEKGLLLHERTTLLDLQPGGPIDAPKWAGRNG